MKLLDAINTVLTAIGENMVLSLESSNPTLGLIKKKIEDLTTELLSNNWWFNYSEYTAYPDTEGRYQVGTNVIDVTLLDGSDDIVTITTDGMLYNQTKNTDVFEASSLKILVLRDMPFDNLPVPAQTVIMYMAAAAVYADDMGIDNKYQQILSQVASAKATMHKIDLAKKKINIGKSPMYRRIARGIRF